MKYPIALVLFIIFVKCRVANCNREDKHGYQRHHAAERRNLVETLKMDCDQSTIPQMEKFTMTRMLGTWYELGKTFVGYIDADDGKWTFTADHTNSKIFNFQYSGRDRNHHCIRPLQGTVQASEETAGEITLTYRTFSTRVKETVRILETDYENYAVLYACLHTDDHTGFCHPGGVVGSIWTRQAHVHLSVFSTTVKVLEQACLDPFTVKIRYEKGSCLYDEIQTVNGSRIIHDLCYQAINPGTCSAHVQRFHYDVRSNKCHEFEYTGCSGNDNNFMTLQECEDRCMRSSETLLTCAKTAPCALHCPPCCAVREDGCVTCTCSDLIVEEPRVKCLQPSDCRHGCTAKQVGHKPSCFTCECNENYPYYNVPAVCLEVEAAGNCQNHSQKYYYNIFTRDCQIFSYTGCGGNNNRFDSYEKCMEKCTGKIVERVTRRSAPGSAEIAKCSYIIVLVLLLLQT